MSKYVPTTGALLEIYRGYRRRNRGLIGSAPPHRQIEAEFDRWMAGVKADAWDECVREGEACGYIGAHDAIELGARNPYREPVDRAEGDGSADR